MGRKEEKVKELPAFVGNLLPSGRHVAIMLRLLFLGIRIYSGVVWTLVDRGGASGWLLGKVMLHNSTKEKTH